jgi:hypothetical protein
VLRNSANGDGKWQQEKKNNYERLNEKYVVSSPRSTQKQKNKGQ